MITLGRGSNNDFVLNDGFVSNFHAEIVVSHVVKYRDLKSRHGSLVSIEHASYHLHNKGEATSIEIHDETELQVGCTLISVALMEVEEAAPSVHNSSKLLDALRRESSPRSNSRETMITSVVKPTHDIARQFDASDRTPGCAVPFS